MPHILFINEFYHPDCCASAVVLANHLPQLARLRPHWRISVIASRRAWDDPDRFYPDRETAGGIQIIRVDRPPLQRASLLRRGLGFFAFARNAVRAARKLDPVDCVVGATAPPQGAAVAARIAAAHNCPWIYKVLDLYPDLAATLGKMRGGGLLYNRWLRNDTQLMHQAAALVPICTTMARRIAQTRNIPGDKIHTIHDGDDPARLTVGTVNHFAQTNNPDGKFLVQYAGNMGLSHPFDTIIDTVRLLENETKIKFQFIGDGPQRGALQQDLPASAQLLPYQPAERLGEMLRAADACLITQHQAMFDQALPYKIYAALAVGLPILFVGDPRCEIAVWIKQYQCGMHIDQHQPQALADAIKRMQSDPQAAAAMSHRAGELFQQRFNSECAATRWSELIKECLSR